MALDTILAKAATLIITVEKLVYGQGSTVAKMYIHYATALRLNIPVLAPLNTIHIAKSLVVVIHVHQIHAKIMALVQMIFSWRHSNVNVKISLKVLLAPCHVSSVLMLQL